MMKHTTQRRQPDAPITRHKPYGILPRFAMRDLWLADRGGYVLMGG